jgi:hypothetical protein
VAAYEPLLSPAPAALLGIGPEARKVAEAAVGPGAKASVCQKFYIVLHR